MNDPRIRETLSVLLGMNIQMPGDDEPMETHSPPPKSETPPPKKKEEEVPSNIQEVSYLYIRGKPTFLPRATCF